MDRDNRAGIGAIFGANPVGGQNRSARLDA
jgi:hypothetical protein